MHAKIDFGGGCAGVIVDERMPTLWAYGPGQDPVDGPRVDWYYTSRSGLSGAGRYVRRPYLRTVATYRDVAKEYPSSMPASGPLCPVTREGVDYSLPLIWGIHHIHRRCEVIDVELVFGSPDSPRRPENLTAWWEAQSLHGRPGCEVVCHTIKVWHPAERHMDYAWRRAAWRTARAVWLAEYARQTPLREVPCGYDPQTDFAKTIPPGTPEWHQGVAGGRGVGATYGPLGIHRLEGRVEFEVRDRDGFVRHRLGSSTEVLEWLRTEPDWLGLGVIHPEPEPGTVLVADEYETAWLWDSQRGLAICVPGEIDWPARVVRAGHPRTS